MGLLNGISRIFYGGQEPGSRRSRLWAVVVTLTFYPAAALLTFFGGLRAMVGMVALILVVDALKRGTAKMRPDQSDRRSFPSGHSAGAWFHAAIGHWNPLIVMWSAAVSASRVVMRRHDAVDVTVGAAIGMLIGMLVRGR